MLRVIANGTDGDTGIMLDGGELGAIALTDARQNRNAGEVPHRRYKVRAQPDTQGNSGLRPRFEQTTQVGDDLEVFVYRDSARQLLATMQRPLATVGQCALLEVVDLSNSGAFLSLIHI